MANKYEVYHTASDGYEMVFTFAESVEQEVATSMADQALRIYEDDLVHEDDLRRRALEDSLAYPVPED